MVVPVKGGPKSPHDRGLYSSGTAPHFIVRSPSSLVPGEILALWYANQLTAVDAGDLHQFGAAHRKWNLYNSHGVVSCGPIASDKQIHRKLTSLLQRQE